jgi:hypothetical protein
MNEMTFISSYNLRTTPLLFLSFLFCQAEKQKLPVVEKGETDQLSTAGCNPSLPDSSILPLHTRSINRVSNFKSRSLSVSLIGATGMSVQDIITSDNI